MQNICQKRRSQVCLLVHTEAALRSEAKEKKPHVEPVREVPKWSPLLAGDAEAIDSTNCGNSTDRCIQGPVPRLEAVQPLALAMAGKKVCKTIERSKNSL